MGGYFDAGDFDRGRHSLVGDVRFRGPHRVSAWWSSLMHYLYLDDPRTMSVVGEPKDANSTVVMYDLIHGFGIDQFGQLLTAALLSAVPVGRESEGRWRDGDRAGAQAVR